jgi:S-adenosylmethionine hydrolase
VSRLVSTYAEIAPGELCALFGSSDHLELAAHAARAADLAGLGSGARVQIQRQ